MRLLALLFFCSMANADPLIDSQLVQADVACRAASSKVIGVAADGGIMFAPGSSPTQAEKDAAIAAMAQYITAPQVAHVRSE